MIPGEVRVTGDSLELNAGREHRELVVVNSGDRPIQIGSHLHLPDANPALDFDREAAQGFRLDVPSGTSVRLEPGVSRTIALVRLGGRRHVPGAQLPHGAARPVVDRGPQGVDADAPLDREDTQ